MTRSTHSAIPTVDVASTDPTHGHIDTHGHRDMPPPSPSRAAAKSAAAEYFRVGDARAAQLFEEGRRQASALIIDALCGTEKWRFVTQFGPRGASSSSSDAQAHGNLHTQQDLEIYELREEALQCVACVVPSSSDAVLAQRTYSLLGKTRLRMSLDAFMATMTTTQRPTLQAMMSSLHKGHLHHSDVFTSMQQPHPVRPDQHEQFAVKYAVIGAARSAKQVAATTAADMDPERPISPMSTLTSSSTKRQPHKAVELLHLCIGEYASIVHGVATSSNPTADSRVGVITTHSLEDARLLSACTSVAKRTAPANTLVKPRSSVLVQFSGIIAYPVLCEDGSTELEVLIKLSAYDARGMTAAKKAILFNYLTAFRNLASMFLTMRLLRSPYLMITKWVARERELCCCVCRARIEISMVRQCHHCRLCGQVVCAECSDLYPIHLEIGRGRRFRICTSCLRGETSSTSPCQDPRVRALSPEKRLRKFQPERKDSNDSETSSIETTDTAMDRSLDLGVSSSSEDLESFKRSRYDKLSRTQSERHARQHRRGRDQQQRAAVEHAMSCPAALGESMAPTESRHFHSQIRHDEQAQQNERIEEPPWHERHGTRLPRIMLGSEAEMAEWRSATKPIVQPTKAPAMATTTLEEKTKAEAEPTPVPQLTANEDEDEVDELAFTVRDYQFSLRESTKLTLDLDGLVLNDDREQASSAASSSPAAEDHTRSVDMPSSFAEELTAAAPEEEDYEDDDDPNTFTVRNYHFTDEDLTSDANGVALDLDGLSMEELDAESDPHGRMQPLHEEESVQSANTASDDDQDDSDNTFTVRNYTFSDRGEDASTKFSMDLDLRDCEISPTSSVDELSDKESSSEEQARLESLLAYGLLDEPKRRNRLDASALQTLLHQLTSTFAASSALIGFVDASREITAASFARAPQHRLVRRSATSKHSSLVWHVMQRANELDHGHDTPVIMVPNAAKDAMLQTNNFVQDRPHVRFLAGAPIRAWTGAIIGAVIIADGAPRENLTPPQRKHLSQASQLIAQWLDIYRRRTSSTASMDTPTERMTLMHDQLAHLLVSAHRTTVQVKQGWQVHMQHVRRPSCWEHLDGQVD